MGIQKNRQSSLNYVRMAQLQPSIGGCVVDESSLWRRVIAELPFIEDEVLECVRLKKLPWEPLTPPMAKQTLRQAEEENRSLK
jgi:hypothetical protein